MKPPPFSPVIRPMSLFFSSSRSFIQSLASYSVSHIKFHSMVSSSPFTFLPVYLTCISLVPLGFLKVEVASGVKVPFLGMGALVRKGVFLQSLLQQMILRLLSQMSSLQLDMNEIFLAYFLTNEQKSVVSFRIYLISWLFRSLQLYFSVIGVITNFIIIDLNSGEIQDFIRFAMKVQEESCSDQVRRFGFGLATGFALRFISEDMREEGNYKYFKLQKQGNIHYHSPPMLKLTLIIITALIGFSTGQQYPTCPGGSPLTLGNSTDPYNLHIIQLSTFLGLNDQSLLQAFQSYLSTGSDAAVSEFIDKNKNFFIIIVTVLTFVSLVLFVLLVRIGDIKFSDKEKFEKLKENGYSSPLSAFFTLIAVALLIFTCFNAYLIPSMISSLKMTECRMDGLNEVFLNGSPQYNWDGVNSFIDKMDVLTKLASSLQGQISKSTFSELLNLTVFGEIYLSRAESIYNGIKDDYSNAQITYNDQNASQNIALNLLIPNLFASSTGSYIFSDLQGYLETINNAMDAYNKLEYLLNNTYPSINQTNNYMNTSKKTITSIKDDYISKFTVFRSNLSQYFSSAEYTLIVAECITCLAVLGCLVSIITIRLIQTKFDYFSLKVYKIIWACHIIVFCLNLAFLLIFNEILLYGQGACLLSQQILQNNTRLEQLIPSAAHYSGMGVLNSCFNSVTDFTVSTGTSNQFTQFASFVQLKEEIYYNYDVRTIVSYPQILQDIRMNLTSYEMGVNGSYQFLNSQLAKINNVLLNDPRSEYCFKHHWQYHPSNCKPGQNIIILPKTAFLPFLSKSNYTSASSTCYILSSYDAYNPHFINLPQFLKLYSPTVGKCNSTLNCLKDPLIQFFGAEMIKQSVVSSLIQQVYTISPFLHNSSYYFAEFIRQRTAFLKEVFGNLNANTNYDYISNGNNCGIVSSMIQGIYNQFCVNFRAQGRQIYLIVFCNLTYSVILILLSFLYSLELESLSQDDSIEPESSERIIFEKSNGLDIPESQDSIEGLESHSRQSVEQK